MESIREAWLTRMYCGLVAMPRAKETTRKTRMVREKPMWILMLRKKPANTALMGHNTNKAMHPKIACARFFRSRSFTMPWISTPLSWVSGWGTPASELVAAARFIVNRP